MAFDFQSEFQKTGWELQKIKFDRKQDRYIATAKNEHGEEMEAWGPDARRATSNLLLNVVARNGMRTASRKLSAWKTLFTDQMPQIAEAYSKAPFYETKAAISFMELGRDAVHRAKAVSEHLQVELVNDPEPYKSAQQMCEDVRKRRRLKISRAGLEHPVWSREEEIAFRTCFDVFGYCSSDSDFGWEGTNLAFAHYAPLVSTEAQKALFTESIAKTAYAAYYRAYGPAKIVVLPQFIEGAQRKENPHEGYPGIHPTQRIPPIEMPRIKPLASLEPDAKRSPGIPQRIADATLSDPNENWSSGVNPLPMNARLHYRDEEGNDPLQVNQTQSDAQKIDTEWAYLNQHDPKDISTMRLAIVNAFRAVLLSPLKELRWNAVHYQDLQNVDPYESDPSVYWDTLENARQTWNVGRFGEQARYQHMPYRDQLKRLETYFYQREPQSGWGDAQKKARDWVFELRKDLESEILGPEQEKDPEKQRHTYEITNDVNQLLTRLLEQFLSEHSTDRDHPQLGLEMQQVPKAAAKKKRDEQQTMELGVEPLDKSRYAGFIGLHLQAIAEVSQHTDEILKAALEDVHERRGAGYHFRSTVLQLNIPQVGPKVTSFAWLLLQPMTSQLATIDSHMAQWLGYNPKDVSPRDYFKMERQLRGGLDAAGYGDIPLALGQWSSWDYKRSGQDQHQDHSPLRVLDPKSHQEVPWAEASEPSEGMIIPQWWADTQPIRDQIGDQFDQTTGQDIRKDTIPYQQAAVTSGTRVASTPYFEHPETHEQIAGESEQTLMQHLRNTLGLPVEEIWKRFDDHNTGKISKVARRITAGIDDLWVISEEELQSLLNGSAVYAQPAQGVANNNSISAQIMRPHEFSAEDLEALARGELVRDGVGDWLRVGEPSTSERYHLHLQDHEEHWPNVYPEPEERPSHPATQMAMAHTGQIPGDENLANAEAEEYNEMSGVNPSYFGSTPSGQVIVKPEGTFHTDEEVSDLAKERAAFAVAHAMGISMPHTTIQQVHVPQEIAQPSEWGGETHSLYTPAQVQHMVSGETASAGYGSYDMPNQFPEDWRRIGLFDNVIGNSDRHTANVMVNQDNRLIPIDHGGAFRPSGYATGAGGDYQGEPLTPEEIEMLQRVQGMDLTPMGIPRSRQSAFHDRINAMLDSQAML